MLQLAEGTSRARRVVRSLEPLIRLLGRAGIFPRVLDKVELSQALLRWQRQIGKGMPLGVLLQVLNCLQLLRLAMDLLTEQVHACCNSTEGLACRALAERHKTAEQYGQNRIGYSTSSQSPPFIGLASAATASPAGPGNRWASPLPPRRRERAKQTG